MYIKNSLLSILMMLSSICFAATDLNALMAKANTGDAVAQYELAMYYDRIAQQEGGGYKSEEFYQKARPYYELSARSGNTRAINRLGVMYQSGLGVARDNYTAFRLYERSASMGDAMGQNNLAFMYHYGLSVPKDEYKAKELYEMAVKQGNASAMYNLGNMYYEGVFFDKPDYKQAQAYFEQALAKGETSAREQLMQMYFFGQANNRGVDRYQKAKEYAEADPVYKLPNRSPSGPGVLSDLFLGEIYFYGLGVEKDYKKAETYYTYATRLSTESYANHARNKLGWIHEYGLVGTQNYSNAEYFYRLAIHGMYGSSEAKYNLGRFYEYGLGVVPKDVKRAAELYEASCLENVSQGCAKYKELSSSDEYRELMPFSVERERP